MASDLRPGEIIAVQYNSLVAMMPFECGWVAVGEANTNAIGTVLERVLLYGV